MKPAHETFVQKKGDLNASLFFTDVGMLRATPSETGTKREYSLSNLPPSAAEQLSSPKTIHTKPASTNTMGVKGVGETLAN
jgi:hypothetical protein